MPIPRVLATQQSARMRCWPIFPLTIIQRSAGAAGDALTTGTRNVVLGGRALSTATGAADNTAIGYDALRLATGANNTAVGEAAMYTSGTSVENVAVGKEAMYSSVSAHWNTAVGLSAMWNTTTGDYNTALGYNALYTSTAGASNVAVGYYALYATTASNNVAVGRNAGDALTTGSNNIIIGYNADASAIGVSNEITLGNGDITSLRIPGIGFYITSTGVGVGTTAPQSALDIGVGSASAPTYKGNIRLLGGALAAHGGLEFQSTTYSSGYGWRIQTPDEGNGSTPIVFQTRANTAAWTELLRVTPAGKVGIGTTAPGGSLDVQGGRSFFAAASELYAIGAKYVGSGGSVYFGATDSTSTPGVQISNSGGSALLNILNGGNVGIGTAAPAYKLDVSGTGRFTDSLRILTGATTTSGLILGGDATAGNTWTIARDNVSTGDLKFIGGTTERVRIDSSGRFTLGYQPRFLAQRGSNQTNYVGSTQSQAVLYDSAVQNVGNHFNTSTGKFTAPVAGMYAFQASVYSNNTFAQAWLVINGSRPSYGDVGVSATAGAVFAATWIFYLAANDTVGYHPYNASSSNQTIYANSIHTWFKGYLIS